MTFTYTLYIVDKTYSDRQLVVIIHLLKIDGRNVRRKKSIIHLPTDFLFIVTVFVRRYKSFFFIVINKAKVTTSVSIVQVIK